MISEEEIRRLEEEIRRLESQPVAVTAKGLDGIIARTTEGVIVLFSHPPDRMGEKVILIDYVERASKRGRKYIKCFKWIYRSQLEELWQRLYMLKEKLREEKKKLMLKQWLGNREALCDRLSKIIGKVSAEGIAAEVTKHFDVFVNVYEGDYNAWAVADVVDREEAEALLRLNYTIKGRRRVLVGTTITTKGCSKLALIEAFEGTAVRWWSRRLIVAPLLYSFDWLSERDEEEKAYNGFSEVIEALGGTVVAVDCWTDSIGGTYVHSIIIEPPVSRDFFDFNEKLWKLGRALSESDMHYTERYEIFTNIIKEVMQK